MTERESWMCFLLSLCLQCLMCHDMKQVSDGQNYWTNTTYRKGDMSHLLNSFTYRRLASYHGTPDPITQAQQKAHPSFALRHPFQHRRMLVWLHARCISVHGYSSIIVTLDDWLHSSHDSAEMVLQFCPLQNTLTEQNIHENSEGRNPPFLK